MTQLTVKDHNRNAAGLTYIYPVISRRSGGLSIGINFNTNNACNWHCVYCQVPNLSLGAAPELDFELLETELKFFLQDVLHGDFYDRFEMEPELRVIKDIAISGNGEPTSVKDFAKAIELIIRVTEQAKISDPFQYVLITNGSLIHHSDIQDGLKLFNQYNGQVWFKLDSATDKGRDLTNHSALSLQKHTENLLISARLCSTWVQTCMLQFESGQGLVNATEQEAYLALLQKVSQQVSLQGVMLYSLARESLQPEANMITSVTEQQLNDFAQRVRQLGLTVKASL
ncbi:MAG: radical SAM protein [Gammaproteobacteria bacterium]|nr:MAG: radical SAM protein [Gammaproteobacteria bacterium]